MNELKKHRFLLALITLLLVIKFIIVPLMEWQDSMVIDLKAKEKKLAKIEKVLSEQSVVTADREKLELMLDNTEKLFFATQAESVFKLNQQQAFEKLLTKHQITTVNFSWEAKTELTPLKLIRYQIKTRLDGQFENLVSLYVDLENSKPWLQINDFNLSTSGNVDNSLGFVRSGNLTLSLYMQQGITRLDN